MLSNIQRKNEADYYGVKEGVDNTKALQLALEATGAENIDLVLPPHDMIITGPLRYYFSNALLSGYGRYSRIIAKGGGYTALTVGPGEGNNGVGNERGGYLKHFAIDTDRKPGETIPRDFKAGVALDNIRFLRVEGLQVEGFNFGFDMINNCFGTSFNDTRTIFGGCRVGLILRGAKDGKWGSGSDIPMFNTWMHGTEAGIWINPGGGGYNLFGGQLSAGYEHTEDREDLGCIVIGKDYETGEIGGSGIVSLKGMDIEGWKRTYAIRGYGRCQFKAESVSFIATDQVNKALGVVKVSDGENGVWKFEQHALKGHYSVALADVKANGSAFTFTEENPLPDYELFVAGEKVNAGTSMTQHSKIDYGFHHGRQSGRPYIGMGKTQIKTSETGELQYSLDFGKTYRTLSGRKTGEGEPKFAANYVGEMYIDTLNRKVYIAVAVNSWTTIDGVKRLNDWVIITTERVPYV